MKLATLKLGGRDGTLVVVSRDLSRCKRVPAIARTLQAALDEWETAAPRLEEVYRALNHGKDEAAQPYDQTHCHSLLPLAYQCADGSVYKKQEKQKRKAHNNNKPTTNRTDPLMY